MHATKKNQTHAHVLAFWFFLASALISTLMLIRVSHAASHSTRTPHTLRLATWNLQWLVAPESLQVLAKDCLKGKESRGNRTRYLYCDSLSDAKRSQLDFNALARYANTLDADIVAIEEVDGASAAKLVFTNHAFCFSAHAGVQNNGFAIRRGIKFRCGKDLIELSLNDRVRRGTELILYPGEAREIRLLSVHLKASCGRYSLDSQREPCATLARQVPVLEGWVDAQAAAGRSFVILGDFNRELLWESGPPRNENGAVRNLFSELNDDDPRGAKLINTAAGQPYSNCVPTQNYLGYIDQILLSESLDALRVPNSFIRLTYDPIEASERKLSDHCPLGVDLLLDP